MLRKGAQQEKAHSREKGTAGKRAQQEIGHSRKKGTAGKRAPQDHAVGYQPPTALCVYAMSMKRPKTTHSMKIVAGHSPTRGGQDLPTDGGTVVLESAVVDTLI